MAQKISVPAQVREQIHFDTLWAAAQDALKRYAGQRWTTLEDHDPGVTLLQALTYITSDLSYRHTLPLVDLLTPGEKDKNRRPSEAIFAPEFGPETALTCGPVTPDDYRRAILDLNNQTQFYFRDAQIQGERPDQRYHYRYEANKGEFRFSKASSPALKDFVVHGGNTVWLALNPNVDRALAEQALAQFLTQHRNLCEAFNQKKWLQPQLLEVKLEIELDDDFSEQHIASLLADVFLCAEAWVSPMAQRSSADALRQAGWLTERVYQGPKLEQGWITTLPPEVDYTKARWVDLFALVSELQTLPEIVQITLLDSGNGRIEVKPEKYPWVWRTETGDPDYEKLIKQVRFFKRGQPISVDKNDLQTHLTEKLEAQQHALVTASSQQVPYGRFRFAADYHSAAQHLPPCYQLQQGWETLSEAQKDQVKQLYQFLLPFEQWLANGCDQLAKLPTLLSFDQRPKEPLIWGGQWPVIKPAVGVELEDILPLQAQTDLKQLIHNQSIDNDKELSILHYLLGYFGEDRAARTLLNRTPEEFRAVQQGFLRQITELAYERAAISVSKISALQRRIAARLGVGPELFEQTRILPDKEEPLPFYIIENRQLLPAAPSQLSEQWQDIAEVEFKRQENILVLDLQGCGAVKIWQLIDLKDEKEEDETFSILANVICKVEANKVYINLNHHVRLKHNAHKISQHWKWRFSEIWLKREPCPLEYAQDQINTDQPTQKRLSINPDIYPYPADLKKGAEVSLVCRKNGKDVTTLSAEVLNVDPIKAWIDVKLKISEDLKDANSQTWPSSVKDWSWTVPYSQDAFSFTISIVLNREWLDGTGDPYLTDQWIRQIVAEEVPTHIIPQIHWLGKNLYREFAQSYHLWQKDDMPLGDRSSYLLDKLSIGYIPLDKRTGIGFTHIVDEENSEEFAAKASKNPEFYEAFELFYVAPNEGQ